MIVSFCLPSGRAAASGTLLRGSLALLFLSLFVFVPAAARAQGGQNSQAGGLPALERRVAALEALATGQANKIAALEAALAAEKAARQAADAALQAADAALATRATALENKTQYLSVSGTDTFFTGTNVHIVNGLGATNGNPSDPFSEFTGLGPATKVNGLGNLIVGYNEVFGQSGLQRGGSHNLVVGLGHDYPSIAGLVAGSANRINAPYASVSGGSRNSAAGLGASVSGGISNAASGTLASVTGGSDNRATGLYAAVSGGSNNLASGDNASVSAGQLNTASGRFASVSGGGSNSAGGFFAATVSGGYQHIVSGDFDWAAGGLFQTQ